MFIKTTSGDLVNLDNATNIRIAHVSDGREYLYAYDANGGGYALTELDDYAPGLLPWLVEAIATDIRCGVRLIDLPALVRQWQDMPRDGDPVKPGGDS